jgi:hypothetical protein
MYYLQAPATELAIGSGAGEPNPATNRAQAAASLTSPAHARRHILRWEHVSDLLACRRNLSATITATAPLHLLRDPYSHTR